MFRPLVYRSALAAQSTSPLPLRSIAAVTPCIHTRSALITTTSQSHPRLTTASLRKMSSSSSSPSTVPPPGRSTSPSDLHTAALFSVSHVTALVTGGGTGIGLMIASALVANGAKVYITGRRAEKLESTVRIYGNEDGKAGEGRMIALVGDVSTKEGCVRLAEEVSGREEGGLQLLVNNAGVARDGETMFAKNGEPDSTSPESISTHFLRSADSHWAETFQTNVTAQYFMSMAFLPLLAQGTRTTSVPGYTSSVVNVSSISGAMKGSSMGQFAYASSKAASTHLSRMLATAFKDVGVRVNVIAPGIFPSEMTAGSSDEQNKSSLDMRSYNPAGRKGYDSDMAATILFLAGRGGVFYNEQILYPDGGNTLTVPAQK